MTELPVVGYCRGVNENGLPCFVREHCMRHTHPSLALPSIEPPFRWWLADHATWAMRCDEYVEDPISRARFPEHKNGQHG